MTIDERDAVAAGADAWLGTLSDWIAIPSVSADPGHAGDVAASAQYLADALRQTGFPTVEVLAGGPYLPAVFAHWPSGDPDAVRVVVYGHHDVQPAAFEDGWTYPPFEPHLVDGLLHGRGASDDKGNVAIHLLGLQAHLRATGRSSPAVDLTLVVEGEEESGSPHISALLADLAGRLPADVVVISDTGIFDARTPSLVTGMRGLVGGELRVQGPDIDLHSGSFGGAVANPITELVRILAAMHDADRRVAIPGFYDGVDEPTPEERALIDALPFDEQAWVTGPAASKEPTGERGYSTLERIGMRPTAEINGIHGGYTGPGGKTIVPTDAYAKLSFRLVGRQDPAAVRRAVDAFVAAQAGPAVSASMHWEGAGVRPLVVPADHPATLAARRALGAAFGTDTVLITREGGSGPEAELAGTIGAPLVFLGVMTNEDRIHAPDERAPVALLLKGAEAVAHLWRELAGLGRSGMG
ncbi:MAG TPA: M20/M25/M40 family metallo-hydrolase [Nakamurella sp.]|jgi:acetylornithine deacetylase/succinyl-diaminopimelate desuccinylase-like protein|nr:M20/M25/M40 family metallo-hydrolase [Nakamurella sp.]